MELWQLKQKQSLSLECKEDMSIRRIREWYEYWNGKVYVAFSGGKDSTVLLDLVRRVYPHVPAVFVDTGLEYPEIREFVKTIDNVVWLKPKMNFRKVIEKYGYPVISKEQSTFIRDYRTTKSEYFKKVRWEGKDGRFKISEKWKFLVDAPFKISPKCCDVMKKQPFYGYEKETGLKPYIGMMASDSYNRQKIYLQRGCNAFDTKKPQSNPLSFWLEDDVWSYIKKHNINYSEIYDKGFKRTGCIFCMFGVHLEKQPNRFQLMKITHPKLWDYCINKLGIGDVLDYINVDCGKNTLDDYIENDKWIM